MSELPLEIARTASPASAKQVAFDHKCQVIPEGDCAELKKLLSLCPTRAQSPPIVGPSSRPGGMIARAISPQFARAKSPTLKKATGLGNAAPNTSTSWKNRLTSWGSMDKSSIAGSLSAAFAPPPQPSSAGPRLVAPVPARGTASPMIPSSDDDDSVEISPSNESIISFEDIDAEFQHAVSGVAMHQHHAPVATVLAGPSLYQPPRPPSSFSRSISELHPHRPLSGGRPKSCLVRSKTPQAPGPPLLLGDGTGPLRATRSHDRESCLVGSRRRADGVPVVCPSPLSSPEEERGPMNWGAEASGSRGANSHKPAAAPSEKSSKLSRWRRFRRAASEESSQRYEPSSSSSSMMAPHMDDVAIKRQIQAGRWPFEAPLNAECSCKNCQDKIEVGLASDYEPKWTRAARIRWLEAQEDAAAPSQGNGSASGSKLPRSASRTAIQADEVAQLHNETVHPMTAAELAEEPTSPTVEQGEPGSITAAAGTISLAVKPPNPTGLEEGDDTLRREIIARRQRMARQSPVMRYGARSMMRQIEEAERREEEAARDRARSRACGSGSGRSSPASPAMSPSQPSTPESGSVSTTPQERIAEGQAATSSYFELQAPPQRVRSPLIPADVGSQPRYARPVATDATTLSMGSVARSLEALASPAGSSAPNSPVASPASEGKSGSASIG
ncbi:uncharacterized protein UTRI_10371 [Ustilago trichophora]|uniref:Uncharacterized protein n=1 Tax=Ustilago trichophora TaxID=86804 RepID=A0A5C3E9B6_9BASI|nr:uncharacterized protein UTRI_10371 [Ustilago trichophora]